VLVNPDIFLQEVETLGVNGRAGIDSRCTLIDPQHIEEDRGDPHLRDTIGSTGSGCGPANKDRVMRVARQASQEPRIAEYLTDVPREVNEAIDSGKRVLVEGTQGFGISLLYGSYPYVTSKDTSASQMAADVGIGPTKIDDVVVVFKAFPTRVGEGPFPGEISQAEAEKLGIAEFGTVTGRPRRVGLWDGEMARYSAMVNGATQCAVTGLDRLDPSCRGVTSHSKLSKKVLEFVSRAEKDVGVPFTLLSTGPGTGEIVDLRAELGFDTK
jgi:adenylosuccinate synthase